MPKDAVIRARTNKSLKIKVDKIFNQMGLTPSQALNLFYAQVALQNGLPFDVKIPNKQTVKAMDDTRKRKGKTFESVEELFEELNH